MNNQEIIITINKIIDHFEFSTKLIDILSNKDFKHIQFNNKYFVDEYTSNDYLIDNNDIISFKLPILRSCDMIFGISCILDTEILCKIYLYNNKFIELNSFIMKQNSINWLLNKEPILLFKLGLTNLYFVFYDIILQRIITPPIQIYGSDLPIELRIELGNTDELSFKLENKSLIYNYFSANIIA